MIGLIVTLNINDIQHNVFGGIMLNVVGLSLSKALVSPGCDNV